MVPEVYPDLELKTKELFGFTSFALSLLLVSCLAALRLHGRDGLAWCFMGVAFGRLIGVYAFGYGAALVRFPYFWPAFPLAFVNHLWLAGRFARRPAVATPGGGAP